MNLEASAKVTAHHLQRQAFLYVRQSTLRQVIENTESTQRQYALRQRAIALGWSAEQIVVIDCDLGKSGAAAADRQGFQQLVAEVSLGHAGIVLGLEVSRLARNCTDWPASWRSARSPTHSSWMTMAPTARLISTIGSCSGSREP